MKLIDCLAQLPDDLRLIDLTATGVKIYTVKELLKKYEKSTEGGCEVRTSKRNYGKETVVSIGVVGGPNLFNQV